MQRTAGKEILLWLDTCYILLLVRAEVAVKDDRGLDKSVNMAIEGSGLSDPVWHLVQELVAKLTLEKKTPRTGFRYPEFLMMLIRSWHGAPGLACLPNDLYYWLQFVTGPQDASYIGDPLVKLQQENEGFYPRQEARAPN